MKDIKIVSRKVAKDLNMPVELVNQVNSFYWWEIKTKILAGESTTINVKGLLTFTISRNGVNTFIKNLIRKIRLYKVDTRKKPETNQKLTEKAYDNLRIALKQRNIIAKQYYEFYTKLTERVREANANSVQELGPHMGGDNQPSEDGIRHTPGGRTGGDSEKETDLCGVSIQ